MAAVPGGCSGSAGPRHAGAPAGTSGAVAGAINLAAVATTTDQRLSVACRTQEQPRGRGGAVTGSADIPWTSAMIAGILTPHACPARCGHGVEPNRQVQIGAVLAPQYRQALDPRSSAATALLAAASRPHIASATGAHSPPRPLLSRQNPMFAVYPRVHAAVDTPTRYVAPRAAVHVVTMPAPTVRPAQHLAWR